MGKFFKKGLGIPIALVLLIAMIILPIPPFLLDFFFTFSIAISLLVLLAGIYCKRPLDFEVFPTILLLTTLLRLALNVASTRVVLLNGHTGTGAAGNVIEAFGLVVIGGSYAVGLVVFSILVIINFVVVTKGAGRISEVSARFTLDSLPGKQMSIDADLNAGLIEQAEAKSRREELSQEVDFYGSMDGASKFIRGDAVAGILILLINLIGGMAIGVFQHDLELKDAVSLYALLTIGDGLVAQIPGLVLSTAAAMMVTRVSSEQDVGHQVYIQVFNNPKPLVITGGIFIILGIIPGMPHAVFLTFGFIMLGIGYYIQMPKNKTEQSKKHGKSGDIKNTDSEETKVENKEDEEITWGDVPQVDTIGLEIGYRLISMVDQKKGADLLKRVKGIRKKISNDIGFLVPMIHIRDNLDLAPNTYRISIQGVVIAEDRVYPEKDLAINPGQVIGELDGVPAKEPAFGLESYWISKNKKQEAESQGYTVVDASTVIATHLSQIINEKSHEILGYEEVQKMLDILGKQSPKLIEDLVPKTLSLGVVVKVLQKLLQEGVPIKNMKTIAQILSEVGVKNQEPEILTEYVRAGLSSAIVQKIYGANDDELQAIAMEPNLEQILQKSLQEPEKGAVLEPGLAQRLQENIKSLANRQEINGKPAVLLTSSLLRQTIVKIVSGIMPKVSVLAYNEIPSNKQIKIVGTVGA